jgi:hypothetical protein
MKTLNEWLDGIRAAIPEARAAGHLNRWVEDVTNALLAMDPEGLRDQGLDGPRRAGFYRDAVLALVYPKAASLAA